MRTPPPRTARRCAAARRAAALVLAGGVMSAAVGCSGGDEPEAAPSPTAARPSVSAAPTRSRAASPTATPSPPPKPVPMTVTGAFLSAAAAAGDPVAADPETGCFDVYPGLLDVSCDTLQLDGGTLLWLAGTEDVGGGQRRRVLRLLTFDSASGGYRLRFVSRDPAGGWIGFQIGPARLTGNGVDGLVVRTRLAGNGASYDVLTWRAGGPLVLRAHRTPARDLRVVARENRLDDYQVSADPRFYIYRRIVWDGAQLTIANYGPVKAVEAPPPA